MHLLSDAKKRLIPALYRLALFKYKEAKLVIKLILLISLIALFLKIHTNNKCSKKIKINLAELI